MTALIVGHDVGPWLCASALLDEGLECLLDHGLDLAAFRLSDAMNFGEQSDVDLGGKFLSLRGHHRPPDTSCYQSIKINQENAILINHPHPFAVSLAATPLADQLGQGLGVERVPFHAIPPVRVEMLRALDHAEPLQPPKDCLAGFWSGP